MKPEEAIERIKDHMRIHRLKEQRAVYITEALNAAIEALKEISLYKNGELCLVPTGVYEKQCTELDKYKEIGTVEECREAVEKQKPKKPKVQESVIDGMNTYFCPSCTRYIGSSMKTVASYCGFCGQAIDTENLEGMEDE